MFRSVVSRLRGAACLAALPLAVALAPTAVAAPAAAQTAPVASAGCRAPLTGPGESTLPFAAAGRSGSYIQDMPNVSAGAPLPVVFDLHGYLEPATFEHAGTALGEFGDRHGFVTVTPEVSEPGLPQWDDGPGSPDIAFLGQLLSHVEHTLCVDERRVYMTGLSMGAMTSSAVACLLSDRVAAVAPVAGLQAYRWCKPARPVPVVAFHGTADPIVAYTGNTGSVGAALPPPSRGVPLEKRSIPAQVAIWAARNGCAEGPARPQHVAADVTRWTYPCPADAAVEFYSIAGAGHTWPGGPAGVYPTAVVGATTYSIEANQIMWDFFRAHPLPGPVHG